MRARKSSLFIVAGVILVAVTIGVLHRDRGDASGPGDATSDASRRQHRGAEQVPAPSASLASRRDGPGPAATLPSSAIMGSENGQAPAVAWTVPASWEAVRNPNGLRLASYRVRGAETGDDAVDISVARAGGTADANIERWRAQFDADRSEERDERSVHDLRVTVVELRGTYRGSGMPGMPGASSGPKPGWAMLSAVVASPSGAPYFFKMLGPASAVQAQHAAFDALVDSLSPR